jgi:hypothetical protein
MRPQRRFTSPPKSIPHAFVMALVLILTGWTAYRQEHQLILTKRT